MDRDNQIYNAIASLGIYSIEHEGNALFYDRMTLTRVERLIPGCKKVWAKAHMTGAASTRAPVR